MKFNALWFTVLAGLFIVSCDNNSALLTPTPPELKKEITKNLAYGTGNRKILDVALPARRGNTTPFIILLHSGAWVSGDKSELSILQDSLCNRGIASINMNYSYASESVSIINIMADINEALAYARKNSSAWSLNLDKVAIGGVSSGAQLAMMYGYKYDTNNSIDCIISGAGPTAIDDRSFLDGAVSGKGIDGINYMVGAVYGGPQQSIDVKFTEASPIKNIKNVPLLMLHGTADEVVPYIYSQMMNEELNKAVIPHTLITLPNVGHNLILGNTAETVYQQMDVWIKKYEK